MMTPEQETSIKAHAQAIAAILYEQTEPEQVKTLAMLEKKVREQVLEYVTPEIGIFLSEKQREQNQEDPENSKVF